MAPRVIAGRELVSGNPACSETRHLGVALCRKGYRESVQGDDEILIGRFPVMSTGERGSWIGCGRLHRLR